MIKAITLFFTIFLSNLRQVDTKVRQAIYESSIPQDCKKFFTAITIFESNWHTNKRAIKTMNFSGFMVHGKLKKFETLPHYINFTEHWFKRKHIENRKDFVHLILNGKYAKQSESNCRKYLSNIVRIEKSL